ncbi:nucleotidyltransferase family protein [Sphingomonas mesophila]|uniref:nucleotidyltransferase family protein n=1 Tax=Sphingomonas mesophila TaxID=2303576 RepID=UPI000E58D2D0|nr:nucleotidyltransferase family protein [Sphingomonas mesophila]
MGETESIDALLAAALRGEAPAWPSELNGPAGIDRFVARTRYHGVAALTLPFSGEWPNEVRARLRRHCLTQAAWELRHRLLLERILKALSERGVESLFLKGTALAYSVYSEPATRERADSDLLIRPRDLAAAQAALRDAGGRAPEGSDGASLQESWQFAVAGVDHVLDLHWSAFNSEFLAPILAVESCLDRARRLDRLNPHARMLGPAEFLLHVGIHRNMHRTAPYFSGGKAEFGADRLVWAVDIKLLAGSFGDGDWASFVALARANEVSGAMREALEFGMRAAGATVPELVLAELGATGQGEQRSAYLLRAGRRKRALVNLRTSGGITALARQLRSLASPPEASLRARYPSLSRAPRFVLLARRLFDFVLAR